MGSLVGRANRTCGSSAIRLPHWHSVSFALSTQQGLAMSLAASPGPSWGGAGALTGKTVSPVAGDRLHSRAHLPRAVSRVHLRVVQETPQAGLLNPLLPQEAEQVTGLS